MSALFIAPMTFSLMTPYQFMGPSGTYYETTLEKKKSLLLSFSIPMHYYTFEILTKLTILS